MLTASTNIIESKSMNSIFKIKSSNELFPHIIIFFISAVFLLLYSHAGSPLYYYEGVDSNMFKIIGTGITQGKLPYTDLFDHKGPLLFYIYALARIFGPTKWGLYVLQIIFMYIALLCQWKISNMFLNKTKSLASLLIVLIFGAITIEEGPTAEFFSLPFIYISFYFTILYLREESRQRVTRTSLIQGLCFGAVALIRLNDACSQIGILAFSIFCTLLLKRQFKDIVSQILYFLLGFSIVVLPFVFYFLAKGILSDAWDGSIARNISYTQMAWMHSYLLKILFLSFLGVSALLTYRQKGDNTLLWWLLLPILLASIFLIGNNAFGHYYFVMLPFFGLTVAINYNKYFISLVLWILVLGGWNDRDESKPMQGSFICVTYQLYKDWREEQTYKYSLKQEMDNAWGKIPEEERDKVWCQNLVISPELDFYSKYGRLPFNRYFVVAHRLMWPEFDKKENIENTLPPWVIILEPSTDTQLEILKDAYSLQYSFFWVNRYFNLYKLNKCEDLKRD